MKEFKESEDPSEMKSIIASAEPSRDMPNTESELPKRQKARREKLDPKET